MHTQVNLIYYLKAHVTRKLYWESPFIHPKGHHSSSMLQRPPEASPSSPGFSNTIPPHKKGRPLLSQSWREASPLYRHHEAGRTRYSQLTLWWPFISLISRGSITQEFTNIARKLSVSFSLMLYLNPSCCNWASFLFVLNGNKGQTFSFEQFPI